MNPIQRRRFLKRIAVGASASLIGATTLAKSFTPREIEGPFYPATPQDDKDMDLTRVAGKTGVAKGQVIEIFGQIFDQNMQPIKGTRIDLWQANTYGRYRHPNETNTAPLDDNFQGWAILKSNDNGQYKIKTIMPGIYPITPKRFRAPHIHFKINKQGFMPLTTQMYFPGHPLNATDALIAAKTPETVTLMTAKRVTKPDSNIDQYQFNIILKGA